MAELVELVLEDVRWEAVGLGALAERAARAALGAAGLEAEGFEIALLACDDARIAALNESFRGRAAATNVLSWPALSLAPGEAPAPRPEEAVFLGDLALAFETCAREAEAEAIPLADHAAHLVVHGCLHLLGHDHAHETEAARMEALERKALARIGVRDPYSR